MHIANVESTKKEAFTSPLFTGSDVTRQDLAAGSQEYSCSVVNFGKGVRNKFHSHDHEQILIITSGKGIVATETEEKTVAVGDVIIIPAGEKHWHGATRDSEFSHIYVTRIGTQLTQLEA